MLLMLFLTGLLLSAFFAGSETGWYGVNPLKLSYFAKTNRLAKILSQVVHPPGSFLTTLMIGNNFANSLTIQAGILAVTQWGFEDVEVITALILTPVVFVFGEVAPKQWMSGEPLRRLLWCAPGLAFFRIVLAPVAFPVSILANKMDNEDSSINGRRELAALLHEGGEALPRETRALEATLVALESRGKGLEAFLRMDMLKFPSNIKVGEARFRLAGDLHCAAFLARPSKPMGLLLGSHLVHLDARAAVAPYALDLPELSNRLDLAQAFAQLRQQKASFALVRDSQGRERLFDLEYALSLLLTSS